MEHPDPPTMGARTRCPASEGGVRRTSTASFWISRPNGTCWRQPSSAWNGWRRPPPSKQRGRPPKWFKERAECSQSQRCDAPEYDSEKNAEHWPIFHTYATFRKNAKRSEEHT